MTNLVPAPMVASRFGVTRRTLSRWLNDASIEFPKPIVINKHLYFGEEDLRVWKDARAANSIKEAR